MLGLVARAARVRSLPRYTAHGLTLSVPVRAGFHVSAAQNAKKRLPRRGYTIPSRSSSLKLSRAKITPDLNLRTAPSLRVKRERESVSDLRQHFSAGLDKLLTPVLDSTASKGERERAMFYAASYFTNSIPRVAKLSDPVLWNQMLTALVAVGQRRHPMKLFAVMKRNGIYPDATTFTSVFRSMRQELLRTRREATPSNPDNLPVPARAPASWEKTLDERGPDAQQWMPSSTIIQHQYFVAALENFRIAVLDFYRMSRGETVASTGLPSPVSWKNQRQRRSTGRHDAMLHAPASPTQYTHTNDPSDAAYAEAASRVTQQSHDRSRMLAESHTKAGRRRGVEKGEDVAMIPSPDGSLVPAEHAKRDEMALDDPEFDEYAEEMASAQRQLAKSRGESGKMPATSVQALVERRHRELDEESRGHLTPWQRMYLTKRKALLRTSENWSELATAYALAISLGSMLGRPNQAWAMYSNISLPGARRGLPWPSGLIFYTVLRHLTPSPNEARDLARAERAGALAKERNHGLTPDQIVSRFDPYAALGPNALDKSLTAHDAARVTLEMLSGGQGAGLTPTGRPFEADSSDGKEMLLQWRPKLRAVVEDWLTVLYRTARTRDPPEKFLDAVWMDAYALNQVVHTLTLMNDEKSASLALRLVAGMFKIYGNLPRTPGPAPASTHSSRATSTDPVETSEGSGLDGTWDALQAAGLGEAPSAEMDEQEQLASHKTREQDQEDNPWLTRESMAEQRKADLLAEESDFPDDLERDQDAKSSIFAMTSGMEDERSLPPSSPVPSSEKVYDMDDESQGKRGGKGQRKHEDWSKSLDPLKRRGHVPEGEELNRFLTGPLFSEKGDALPVYTRRRELRFVLRNPRNRAMAHQLHTNIRICSHVVGQPELYDWLAGQIGVPAPPSPEVDLKAKTAGMSSARRRRVAASMHKYPFGRPPTILPFDMRPSPFGRTRHLRAPRARDGHLVPTGWNEAGGEKSRSRRRTLSKAASTTRSLAHKSKAGRSTAGRDTGGAGEDALKEEFARFSKTQEGEPEVSPSDTAWSTPSTWGAEDPARSQRSSRRGSHDDAFPGPAKFSPSSRS